MPAKRLKRRRPDLVERVRESLEPVEEEPLLLTCTHCGARVERTAHTCPHCSTLFYERTEGKAPRAASPGPHKTDAEVAEFAQRMDRLEKTTRVLCTIGGIMFALLALLSLWGLLTVPMVGGRGGVAGIVIFGLLAAVCLARGLKGEGADLGIIDKIPGFRTFR